MALITYAPTGQTMNTDLTVASKGPVSDASLLPPYVSLENELISGSLQAQVNTAGGSYVAWKDGGTESTRALWLMDSANDVDVALATIATNHDAGTSVTIGTDGLPTTS